MCMCRQVGNHSILWPRTLLLGLGLQLTGRCRVTKVHLPLWAVGRMLLTQLSKWRRGWDQDQERVTFAIHRLSISVKGERQCLQWRRAGLRPRRTDLWSWFCVTLEQSFFLSGPWSLHHYYGMYSCTNKWAPPSTQKLIIYPSLGFLFPILHPHLKGLFCVALVLLNSPIREDTCRHQLLEKHTSGAVGSAEPS